MTKKGRRKFLGNETFFLTGYLEMFGGLKFFLILCSCKLSLKYALIDCSTYTLNNSGTASSQNSRQFHICHTTNLANTVGHVSYGSLRHTQDDTGQKATIQATDSILLDHFPHAVDSSTIKTWKRLHL